MNEPALISDSICSNSGSITNKETLSGTSWTKATCNAECNSSTRAWCTNFFLGKGTNAGQCHLYEAGCTLTADANMEYYTKLAIPANTEIEYDASSTLLPQENAFFTYFRNDHSATCAAITSCEIKASGCTGAYGAGNLAITANTGVVTAKQNIDAGFHDIVCIKCSNAAGSTTTYDNWTVVQKPNCNTLTAIGLTNQEYGYDTGATTTAVYDHTTVFTNSKATATGPLIACPVLGCVLFQTDCVTALVAPFDTKLTIEGASPWTLRISQTQASGYPNVAVCYKCNNGYGSGTNVHTYTSQVTIRQHIDCSIALSDSSNSTSSLKNIQDPISGTNIASVVYAASPTYKAITEYALSTSMFTNVNNVDCGAFTACSVKPSGCTGAYTGRAQIGASPNFAMSITQNVDAGYTETLCVECQNAAGSTIQKDGWIITQTRNCGTALTG